MSSRISNFLLILFLVLIIPSIAVYAYNANHEYHESEESKIEGLIEKSAEQRAEFMLFAGIAIIYAIPTIFIIVYRNKTLPYYVILVTTVVISIIYYLSISSLL